MSKNKPYLYPLALMIGASLVLGGCGSTPAKPQEKAAPAQEKQAPAAEPAKTAAVDLKDAVAQYRKYVIDQTDRFVKDTEAFTQAVKSGDIEKAKTLYAPSRQYFERIEPIAESLGDFDPWIDARENDVPDNEWRGFHKLEKALWVGKSTAGQDKVADQLLQDVKLLRVKVENVEIEPAQLISGAVELLNEVSSTKVTGEEERYSHTDLYDFAANVEGAAKIFELVKPQLEKKDAALAKDIQARFAALDQELAPFRKNGGYVLFTELTKDQTKKLSQAIDALAEPLSQMGKVLEG